MFLIKMLKTTKSVVINGSSRTASGEVIATMHFSISESGNIQSSENVANKTLYQANKKLVRDDMDEFTAICREEEDKYNEMVEEVIADEV